METAVCTGQSVLHGFSKLPGPRNWAVWVILVPQAFVAVVAIAGLAGAAATALILALPGDVRLWMVVSLSASTFLVFLGRYRIVEKTAAVLACTLILAACHIPFVTFLILYLNRRALPKGLQASVPVFLCTAVAGGIFRRVRGDVFFHLGLGGPQANPCRTN